MIRDVNLIGHLPLYVQGYREIKGIMNAEEPEVQLVEDISEVIKDNMFILHTDEEGIKRYENMFGVTPQKSDSLYDRQIRVLTKYTNTVVYTLRGLIERLNAICGAENYTLELIPDEYKIKIGLHLRVSKLNPIVSPMLVDMIPANMFCEYSVNYNTHGVIAKYPRYLLMQFTNQEIFDELTDEHISATCDNITNYTMESFEDVYCEHMVNFGMRKV